VHKKITVVFRVKRKPTFELAVGASLTFDVLARKSFSLAKKNPPLQYFLI